MLSALRRYSVRSSLAVRRMGVQVVVPARSSCIRVGEGQQQRSVVLFADQDGTDLRFQRALLHPWVIDGVAASPFAMAANSRVRSACTKVSTSS